MQQVATDLLSPHSKAAAVGGWAYVFAASAPAPAHVADHTFTTPTVLERPHAVRWPCHYAMQHCTQHSTLYTLCGIQVLRTQYVLLRTYQYKTIDTLLAWYSERRAPVLL